MGAAEPNSMDIPVVYRKSFYDSKLMGEIDKLRKEMIDSFITQDSLNSGAVMELSRRLDQKINQYMKQALIRRDEAR
ncbi:hypothetical protein SD71_11655 [Cohnella kolymensis]|uniref:Sporulation protein Spo0E n=1 Tax=Cohnella kolymensis TaxID=1590652 RepID=A0ABR5A4K9_9BACL|nr:aspartyl-phosphate phosphatase Spo0E family protein [Cohnella kolymensis]KIL35983.1 hypothetical protein SD71_11655 [Cohnella kolymensis]